MIVKNQDKKTILAKNLKVANSPIDNFIGLLKKSNPRSLRLNTRFGIHTFFLKDPIDVIILNSESVVQKTATVSPNRIFFYNPKNSIIIELPMGTIKKSRTEVGDSLTISDIIKR